MAEGQAIQQPQNAEEAAHQAALSIVGNWLPKKETTPQPQRQQRPTQPQQPPRVEAKPEVEAEPEPAQASGEAETEETPATEQEPETKQQRRRYKLKYKGQELEKDEGETLALAQQGFDYTQKSQALAKERNELQATIRAQTEPALREYAQRLQLFEKAVWKALAPELQNTDWNALARDDPAQWAQKMQAVTNVNSVLAAVQQEQQQLMQRQAHQMRDAQAKQVAQAREVLERDLPEWSDSLYQNIMRSGIEHFGFTPEEVGAMSDPRAIKVLHAAMKYMDLQKAKPEMEKRVASVPKVLKPGTAEKPNPEAERFGKAMADLKKSGGRDDEAFKVARFFVR